MLRTIYSLSMKKKLGKKESVSKKGRKNAKLRPTLDDSAFDDLDVDLAHGMDYMETTETVNEGRTSSKTEELNVTNDTEQLNVTNDTVIIEEKGSGEKERSTKNPVSSVVPKFSTAVPKEVNVAMPEVSTASIQADSTAHPTPTTAFEDKDIFLADALPLPTIDPKDKGKEGQDKAQMAIDEEVARQLNEQIQAELERERVDEEEATNAALIREYNEIHSRINADSIIAARLQEEERAKFTVKERAKFLHDTIAAQRKEKKSVQDFVPISSVEDKKGLKRWDFYENCRVHTLILEDGTEIHMLAEGKYTLIKETIERMISLKLIAESASDGAYNLLRFIQKQIDESGSYDGSKKDL
nr:hypothetical protein [Tanacetum cinerariifolium]